MGAIKKTKTLSSLRGSAFIYVCVFAFTNFLSRLSSHVTIVDGDPLFIFELKLNRGQSQCYCRQKKENANVCDFSAHSFCRLDLWCLM